MNIQEAAPLVAATFRKGDVGWPIIVCQDALNSHFQTKHLALDGAFGAQTERAAREVQEACKVKADGIVGPVTQEAFVKAKCVHAEQSIVTPPGLLAGICDIESDYQWAAVSPLNANGTHDYGPTQWSLIKPSAEELLGVFNPDYSTRLLAGEVRGAHSHFVAWVPLQRSWELAALNHNWPTAAYAIAHGKDAWLSEAEDWLTAKGYGSGWDYVNHYIAVATAQINWS